MALLAPRVQLGRQLSVRKNAVSRTSRRRETELSYLPANKLQVRYIDLQDGPKLSHFQNRIENPPVRLDLKKIIKFER